MKKVKLYNVKDVKEIVKYVGPLKLVTITALINVLIVMELIKINVQNVYIHLEV